MILKNYYKLLSVSMSNDYSNNLPVKIINKSGAECTVKKPSSYQGVYMSGIGFSGMNNAAATSFTNNSVIFGDGDTPASFDDYYISGKLITGITTSVSFTYEADENGISIESVFSITNNNANSITIKEVACTGCYVDVNSWQYTNACLIERTVLETPITIEAGGVGQVTYTIRMNYPTA